MYQRPMNGLVSICGLRGNKSGYKSEIRHMVKDRQGLVRQASELAQGVRVEFQQPRLAATVGQ